MKDEREQIIISKKNSIRILRIFVKTFSVHHQSCFISLQRFIILTRFSFYFNFLQLLIMLDKNKNKTGNYDFQRQPDKSSLWNPAKGELLGRNITSWSKFYTSKIHPLDIHHIFLNILVAIIVPRISTCTYKICFILFLIIGNVRNVIIKHF